MATQHTPLPDCSHSLRKDFQSPLRGSPREKTPGNSRNKPKRKPPRDMDTGILSHPQPLNTQGHSSTQLELRQEITYYLTIGVTWRSVMDTWIFQATGLLPTDPAEKREGVKREGVKREGKQKKRKAQAPLRLSASKKIGTEHNSFRLLANATGGRTQSQKKINACRKPCPGARGRSAYCTLSPLHGRWHNGCWRQKPSARHGMRHSISLYTGKPW